MMATVSVTPVIEACSQPIKIELRHFNLQLVILGSEDRPFRVDM